MSENRLDTLLAEEIEVCESLLAATRETVRVAQAGDAESIGLAVARRGDMLARLDRLERKAAPLRKLPGAVGADPVLRDRLVRTTKALIAADRSARAAADQALTSARHEVGRIAHGQKAFHSYRGPADPLPRFADQRG